MTSPDGPTDPASILVVVPNLNVGGTERHLCQIMPRLNGPRHRITLCTLSEKGNLAPTLVRQGVPVHQLSPPVTEWPRVFRLFLALRAGVALWRLIERVQPSIVHFYLPAAYLLGGVIARIRGSRHLVMSRRSLNRYQRRYPVMSRIERRLHRHMSAVLGNSRAVLGELEGEGVPYARLGLIYDGVDLAPQDRAKSRAASRRALGIDDATFVMAIVANLIPYKGHQDLLTALGGIRERLPASWRLVCVGRDQEQIQNRLCAKAERLQIAENVHFLGERWDVPDLLAAADLGLLCSHEEGFPNVILEYMAAGLAVVATDVGGTSEALVARQTGLLVPARDPQALGRAILEMAADRVRAGSMGQAGRRVVEQRFSLERCVTQYRALYDALIAGSTAPVSEAIGAIDPREDARRLTVSVVIPVYNRAKTVLRAIASVLAQSHPVLEVVVVDDGSDDGTAAVVEALADPRVRVIRHPANRGAASARNTGIKAARGDLIALLDSDDQWMPRKLEKQVRVLASSLSRDPAVVSGFVVHESGRQWPVALDAAYDVTRDRAWGCHGSSEPRRKICGGG